MEPEKTETTTPASGAAETASNTTTTLSPENKQETPVANDGPKEEDTHKLTLDDMPKEPAKKEAAVTEEKKTNTNIPGPIPPTKTKEDYKEYLIDIAKVAHQANRAFLNTLGDTSEKDWENLSEEAKKETAEQVEFSLQNEHVGAEAHHIAWMNEMKEKGYTHGEVGDMKHPLLVPFDLLPAENQKQHKLFFAVVQALK